MTRLGTTSLVAAYLGAIVAANLSLYHWGPRAAIYNAFVFIGLDLVARDRLHEAWRGHLLSRMAALIATGSILSYAVSLALGGDTPVATAGRIALASGLAFGCAAVADALVYQALRHREWLERANWSNLAGAAVDSIVFLPVAFGGFPWATIFALFCAKVAGGVVWSFVLRYRPGQEWAERNRRSFAQ